ncbi:hypothetical protein OROHE_007816 [Orobanche hederae]
MDVEAESPSSSRPAKPSSRLMMTSASPNSKRSRRKSCMPLCYCRDSCSGLAIPNSRAHCSQAMYHTRPHGPINGILRAAMKIIPLIHHHLPNSTASSTRRRRRLPPVSRRQSNL